MSERAANAVGLARFWKAFEPVDAPHVHEADRQLVLREPYRTYTTVEAYIASDDFGEPGPELQLGVLPAPFAGDLDQADIFILLLNPGFDTVDLYDRDSAFRDAYARTLRQDLAGEAFPFVYLNPAYCWTGAYRWWERKLRDTVQHLAERRQVSYLSALKLLSQHLAAIELVPYHSVSGPSHKLQHLPSANTARDFVHNTLLPRAHDGEVTLIVTRSVSLWGLDKARDESGSIIIYGAGHSRGASLTAASAGGEAILERLSP